MVVEDSLRGVTSNPSIFEKAVLGSNDYDDDLVEGAREELDPKTIYERLAIRDLQGAADVLDTVHRESNPSGTEPSLALIARAGTGVPTANVDGPPPG